MPSSEAVKFVLHPEEVKDFAGVLAELGVAVHETKVIEQDDRQRERFARVQEVVNSWLKLVQLREQLARAEREVLRDAS